MDSKEELRQEQIDHAAMLIWSAMVTVKNRDEVWEAIKVKYPEVVARALETAETIYQGFAEVNRSATTELRPKIVCLCGSTRFVDHYNAWRKALTLKGYIVLAIEIVTTQSQKEDQQHSDPELKKMLDELHKRKIDLADEVLVLDVDGYIGESTRGEIEYATKHNKVINFLSEIPAERRPPIAQLDLDRSAMASLDAENATLKKRLGEK